MPRLHLGTRDTDRRAAALQDLAAAVGAHGQRGPSWHVLIQRLADAYEVDSETVARLVQEAMYIAQGEYVAELDD